MFGLATRVLCISVGYLLPAYKCFKLMRGGPEAIGAAPDASAQRDVVKGLLKHWIVISGFTAVELVADTFLFWLPLVDLAKLGFVVWLVLPGIHGADVIYDYIVEPYLVRNEEKLDKCLQQARAVAHRSSEKVSLSAYDRWMGYMQGVVNQHETGAQPTAEEQSGYSGLSGLLKTVSQKIPQPSSAANYLAGISGITQGAQPTQPEPADKPTLTSMLTSWAASFSAGSSTGMSDQQRLRDIKSRKLQLQKLVSQLEGSERAIIDRNASPKTPTPENSEPTSAHTDASEFEDDAVMVGQPSNDAASGSRTQSKSADSTKNSSDKKSSATGSTSSRRWFW